MFTRCPQCETLYRLTNDQVEAAGGKVRCSRCDNVFNALDHMDRQEEEESEQLLEGSPDEIEIKTEEAQPEPEKDPIVEDSEQEAATAAPPSSIPDILLQSGKQEPHIAWWGAALCLTIIAALQMAWLDRTSLIKDPQGKDFLTTLCSITGCSLPQPRAPGKFRVLSREMSSDDQRNNTLVFTLVMANKADFAQPHPYLKLNLFDNNRKAAGQRIFTPKEYLSEKPESELLQPDEAVYITLELLDPSPNISGFEIKFL